MNVEAHGGLLGASFFISSTVSFCKKIFKNKLSIISISKQKIKNKIIIIISINNYKQINKQAKKK